jgi:hypothetical protein
MPDKAMPEGGLAITLMPTVAARERELMDAMLKPEAARRLKEASWDEVAARVYLPQYQAIAYEHGGHCAGMSIGDVPTCARDVAAAIGERMAAQSDEAWPEDERLRQGAWAIGAIMAATLAQADWTLATAPGDPVRLVNGDMSLDPFSLAQAIVTGRMDAAEWAERCRSLGIADVTLAPDAPRIEEPNPVAS